MIPGYKILPLVYFPKCETIIHHKKHSYDEHGRVIVVDDVDEDRQQFIDSFADQCGLKNIMRLLIKQGVNGPLAEWAMTDEDAVDVSGYPTNVNELKDLADSGDQMIRDVVANFNKTYGTNYSVEEYIRKSTDGSLINEVTEHLKKQENEKEGE